MNRKIIYVDDEARNLTVFEASMPPEWKTHTFASVSEALEKLEDIDPAIVISDQRMPQMSGVEFLAVVKKVCPNAVRIIVTGYSDEDLVIDSVRQAQVFDYIRKPWDVDELEASLKRAFEHHDLTQKTVELTDEVNQKHRELEAKNTELQNALLNMKSQNLDLMTMKMELEAARAEETRMRLELESWVHPFVVNSLKSSSIKFPIRKNLVGITFDIVNSSAIHDKTFENKSVRSHILRAFSESVLRHGGWRESSSGDSAYAHFGLLENSAKPIESAFAVARELKVFLNGLSDRSGIVVECGIGIHAMNDCIVDLHQAHISTASGLATQKSFDTSSSDVDLLHRVEKLAHALDGSNIIFTKESLAQAGQSFHLEYLDIGSHLLKGQSKAVELCLIPSKMLAKKSKEEVTQLIEATSRPPLKLVA